MNKADTRAMVLAAAARLDLVIDPALLDGVASSLALFHRHAGQFMEFAGAAQPE